LIIKGGFDLTKGQDRDVNIRRVLCEDLNNTRRNLQELNELVNSERDENIIDSIHRLLLDIRNLDKKISLSPVGEAYILKKDIPKEATINKKLRTYDKEMTQKSTILVKATSTLNNRYLDGKIKDLPMEMNKIRRYLNDLRNDFEHREDIIKGVKF
jgi:hypothetical protein